MSLRHVFSASLIALSIAAALPASAQTVTFAADNSANYTSDNGDPTTSNRGTGFASPFTVTSGPRSSFYFYDSRLNGGGGGNTLTGVGINDANNRRRKEAC